jgi:hypothetical protein
MAVAAELRALAVIDALALGLEPGLVEAPRNGVELLPIEGMAKLCITSAAVTCMRTILFTGTTISLSTESMRICPSSFLISLSGIMFDSKRKPPWSCGYS